MKILVAIYDSKAESYGEMPSAIAAVLSKGDAIRGFETEVKNPKSKLNAYPTDFSLWQLGTFDERKGTIYPLEQKINLSNAWEVPQDIKQAEEQCNDNTVSKTHLASQLTGQPLRPSTPIKQPSQHHS